jgi:transposase
VIHLTHRTRIFLAANPIDFRKQIDGVVAYCKNELQNNPRNGALFVFVNRARTMLRILHFDGTGYWLATKRLSQGHFPAFPVAEHPLTAMESACLMSLIKSAACEAVQLPVD